MDFADYYAASTTVDSDQDLFPRVALERYAVIKGEPRSR